jgi:hypothetical protein
MHVLCSTAIVIDSYKQTIMNRDRDRCEDRNGYSLLGILFGLRDDEQSPETHSF